MPTLLGKSPPLLGCMGWGWDIFTEGEVPAQPPTHLKDLYLLVCTLGGRGKKGERERAKRWAAPTILAMENAAPPQMLLPGSTTSFRGVCLVLVRRPFFSRKSQSHPAP